MPRVGEVRRAKELGYKAIGHSFIWHACVDCGKERWVQIKRGLPSSLRCYKCAYYQYHQSYLTRPHTEEEKRKVSERWKLVGHPKGMLGKHHSEEAKQKMSLEGIAHPHNWRGGITALVRGIRRSPEYYQWRKAVLGRDNHTCRDCGGNGIVDAHHIQSLIDYPEGVFEIDNGLTLCEDCHKRHTYWQKLTPKKLKTIARHRCNLDKDVILTK